jgi:MFS family permease
MSQRFWYLAGVGTFIVPMGMQTILFPWLVVVQLHEGAERLGLAQMCTQLPAIFLILFGGVLADRMDARKILLLGHLLAALPMLGLALALSLDGLSYSILIVYALLMGVVTAFVQPARDGLLNRVAGGEVQKTVMFTMGLTFLAQLLGYFLASQADDAGPVMILLVQAVIVLVGMLTIWKLAPTRQQLFAGLRLVLDSDRMFPALIILLAVAFFFGGSFSVLNPLIVRDIYQGGANEISMTFAAFGSGTITMLVLLIVRGGIVRQGRAMLLSMLTGGLTLGVGAFHLPFMGYLAALFFWGMSGGVAMSMGRTIMQEAAPENARSRVMSVFSLATLGGMPFGALLMGYCAGAFGPLASLLISVAGVWVTSVGIVWHGRLWGLTTQQ